MSSFRGCSYRLAVRIIGSDTSISHPARKERFDRETSAAVCDLTLALSEPRGSTIQATHNTLSENVRTQTAELLNRQLAGAIDLHGQLKQAH